MSKNRLSWRVLLTWMAVFWLALVLETRLPLSEGEHKLVLIGLTLAFFWALGKMATASPGIDRPAVPVRVTTVVIQPSRAVRPFRDHRHTMACRRLHRTARRNEVH